MSDDTPEGYDKPVGYDKSVTVVFCPNCGCTLKFCDPAGFPVDCDWWCPACENYFADKEASSDRDPFAEL